MALTRSVRWWLLSAALIAAIVAVPALSAQRTAQPAQPAAATAPQLLQSGINKQTVDGRLDEAIAIYQRIVSTYPSERAVVATALVRLAQCHEQLGNRNAQALYERVLREFGDQRDAAAQAKTRLAALGTPTAGASSGAPNMRQVATIAGMSLDAYAGHLSPDGTKISGVDFDGNLIVRDVRTGAVTRLTSVDTSKETHDGAGDSVWSPDGKNLAYQWFLVGPPRTKEIRIIAAEGGKPRTLLPSTSLQIFSLNDWSRDGCYLLAYGGSKLMLVSTADGSLRTLREFAPGSGGSEAGLSLDGRYLAFSARPRGFDQDDDLFVMPIDGGAPVPVAATTQSEYFVAWAPDGQSVIFSRRGGGGTGLWSVPIVDGRGVGEPALLWDALPRLGSLGLSRTGALAVVGERATLANLYVASVDFVTGRVERAPAQVGWVDRSALNPAWSPDGTRLAFSTNMPSPAIGVLAMSTGQLKQIPLSQFKSVGSMSGLTWSADGRSLLFTATDTAQATGFYRLGVESGAVGVLISPESSGVRSAGPGSTADLIGIIGSSPDASVAYKRVNHRSTTRQVSLRERRVADGSEREIFRSSDPTGMSSLAVSPDGRSLAFVIGHFGPPMTRSLEILSLVDGTRRTLRQPMSSASSMTWTRDGTALLLSIHRPGSTEANVNEVWVYPLDGSEPRKTELAASSLGLFGIAVHPDAHRVAFSASSPERTTDIWLLENFLPKAPAKGGAGIRK